MTLFHSLRTRRIQRVKHISLLDAEQFKWCGNDATAIVTMDQSEHWTRELNLSTVIAFDRIAIDCRTTLMSILHAAPHLRCVAACTRRAAKKAANVSVCFFVSFDSFVFCFGRPLRIAVRTARIIHILHYGVMNMPCVCKMNAENINVQIMSHLFRKKFVHSLIPCKPIRFILVVRKKNYAELLMRFRSFRHGRSSIIRRYRDHSQ